MTARSPHSPQHADPGPLIAARAGGAVINNNSQQKLRVLCLHGYHGSASIMQQQMRPLLDGIPDIADFVWVDAPSIATGDFGWWHGGPLIGPGKMRNWERTREWIVDLFAHERPFDGVFGFSQGAALTGLLPGLLEPSGPLTFNFAIMAGGFQSKAPEHAELFSHRLGYTIPSIHIIGRTDGIVPSPASYELARQFESPVVLEHPGGHIVAATPLIRDRVTMFLEDMTKQINGSDCQ